MDYSIGISNLKWLIPSGTNIILSGDLFSGKDLFYKYFIEKGLEEGEACILVSTNETAQKILENFDGIKMDNLCIIDCVSSRFGATVEMPFFEQIRYIESPMDLTMIMVALNEFIDNVSREKNIKKLRIVFDSVSTLLMYSNLRTVFKFLHVVSTRVRSGGGVSLLLIEEQAHDDMEIKTIQQISQGIINMDSNEIIIRGFKTDRVRYEIVNQHIQIKP
ncbi:hypothetical protein JCM15415_14990 [Methanobacterium movens]